MNQEKMGAFLKVLRKEKGLTQEQFADQFFTSSRTVSRWETGKNLPDLSVLIEIANFYQVSIDELIDGERNEELVEQNVNETVTKVATYSDTEKKRQRMKARQIVGGLFFLFGLFIIFTAMAIFPSESSWGSIYSIIGTFIIVSGIFFLLPKRKNRIFVLIGSFVAILSFLIVIDFVSVMNFNQVPRFAYLKESGNQEAVYHAPFYKVIRSNIGTDEERFEVQSTLFRK